jgi:glycosyltransferase involved in cell wall biosynthesis
LIREAARKLRLLQIINNLSAGGAEKLILETLPLYREKGLDVHLLLLNNYKPAFYDELVKTSCCSIHILGKSSVYNPLLIFKIVPYLRKYHIVQVHLFPALYWVALAKFLSFSRTVLCFTEHGTTNRRRKNPLFKPVDRFIYRQYRKIISISGDVDESLRAYLGIRGDKISLIRNGINLEKFRSAQPFPKSDFFSGDNPRIIIQVSRFYEPKDQATLIRSLTYLPENVKLLLVGDGELLPDCRVLAEELHVDSRIIFTGVRMDVPRLLKTADVVVLSSKHEGLSLSCLEGMASGKPFLASDAPGIRNIVKGSGILFPQADEKALANEIMDLLKDKNKYESVATACQQRAAEYSIDIMIDQYIELWNELTGQVIS